MTDLSLAEELMVWLEFPASCPADMSTTITTAGVFTFVFADTIGATNDWVGGIMKITSGDGVGKFGVIISSTDNSVTLATRFHKDYKPGVGDTVTLSKGPLGEARIFLFDPASLRNDVNDDSKRYFVAVTPGSGEVDWRSMGGRSTMATAGSKHAYSFEILAMSPHYVGGQTASQVKTVREALPIMKEQIVTLTHGWRASEGYNAFSMSPIAWGYGGVDIPGMDGAFNGCLITFDMSLV